MVEKNVDQIEQDFARFKQPAVALAGGIAAALVIATLPHVYLENIVGATGLSEIIPAAAPPLGNTARALIAVVAGLVSASALFLFLNHKTKSHEGGSDMSLAIRKNVATESTDQENESRSRRALPKLNLSAKSLTKFLKKPKKSSGQVTELKDLPDIRRADRHPDAPARQPIFAASDLGAPLSEKIKRFDKAGPDDCASSAGEPKPLPTVTQEAQGPVEKYVDMPSDYQPDQDQSQHNVERPEPVASKSDLSDLSLDQLADRLEAGLERLEALQMRSSKADREITEPSVPDAKEKVSPPEAPLAEVPFAEAPLAEAPVAMPPLRSVDSVEADHNADRRADMDAALKAALGTLERMTAQR
ncbi:MAG: hypothetical protein COA41_18120 [Sphingopyxis sp.]|nr:MAG: hypothetical protein COA41_18120 [Sphingopyxis sp.]